MNARLFLAAAFLAVAFFAVSVSAQETVQLQQPAADTAAAQQPQTGQPAVEKKPEVKTPEAAKPQSSVPLVQKTPIPAAVSAEADALTLLETADGDFRSARIPGMTFEKKKILAAGETAPEDKAKDTKPSSVSKSGWIVKAALGLVLIFIFFLYRFNRKGSRKKVLRRFPK